ncbi:unnamed protein product, partial [marine sediment metagenome]
GAVSVISLTLKLLDSIVDWERLFTDSEIIPEDRRIDIACNHIYGRCGYENMNTKLELLGMAVAHYFEDKGYQSMYLPATYAGHVGIGVKIPGFHGPFSHRHS